MALGTWGIDTTDNTVWAVVNHNSEFAVEVVVPEPGTFGLILAVGLTWLVYVRRRTVRA
jgi:hypothetical protein